MPLSSFLNLVTLDTSDDYKPVILQNVHRQFELVGSFLMIRLRLCVFCKNISDVMLRSYCVFSGVYDFDLSLYWRCSFDHLSKDGSVRLLNCKVTLFPFVIKIFFCERYLETM